jgi:ppGpp synthetase/RelA/SpoT-type nucleotidyltranferase
MPLTAEDIQNAVLRYEREYDRYAKLADAVYERCLRIVEETGLRATVQRRTKKPQSLRKKLLKIQRKVPPDLAAVRVGTYLESDRAKMIETLQQAFDFAPEVTGHPNPDTKSRYERAKHYRAIHCQVLLKSEDAQGQNSNLAGTTCEIQVCSMLAHVWNEIEHDLGYKPETGTLSEAELDCLDALGQLVRAGDVMIKALLDANRERVVASESPFNNQFDFMARMQKQFPDSTEFHSHAAQLYDVLLEYELDSPSKIRDALLESGDGYQRTAAELVNKLKSYLEKSGDHVVMVDPATSDRLAMLLLEKKVDDLLQRYPAGRGMGRPMRLVSLARRFKEMKDAEHELK